MGVGADGAGGKLFTPYPENREALWEGLLCVQICSLPPAYRRSDLEGVPDANQGDQLAGHCGNTNDVVVGDSNRGTRWMGGDRWKFIGDEARRDL